MIPTVGTIAVVLNLFGRDRGHFRHLQSAIPVSKLMIEINGSIVRR